MRFYEFADAEAQLGLLRTIIDNTWTAIAKQAEQKKRADAELKAQAKLKPRAKKPSKRASLRIPTPPASPVKKPQAAVAQQPPQAQSKPTPRTASPLKPLPFTNPQLKPLPRFKAEQPKPAAITPLPLPKNRSVGSKTTALGQHIGAVKKRR